MRSSRITLRSLAGVAVAAFSLACAGVTDPADPSSPLAGINETAAVDSTGTTIPEPFPPTGPGYVRGTVLGPSAPGAGNDSLNSAPRIADVTVRVYPVTGGTLAEPELGPIAATVVTGADGKFQTPVLGTAPAEYVITFTPPAGAPYWGSWARARIHGQSHEWPWWVVLAAKP